MNDRSYMQDSILQQIASTFVMLFKGVLAIGTIYWFEDIGSFTVNLLFVNTMIKGIFVDIKEFLGLLIAFLLLITTYYKMKKAISDYKDKPKD